MDIDAGKIGTQAGGGFLVGGMVGFAAKKVLKIVAFLGGVVVAGLMFLEQQGIASVDWTKLQSFASSAESAASGGPPPFVMEFFSILPATGGFAAGAVAGFKTG
jgi:uncharacterized membrane protein (Fun14 family)